VVDHVLGHDLVEDVEAALVDDFLDPALVGSQILFGSHRCSLIVVRAR